MTTLLFLVLAVPVQASEWAQALGDPDPAVRDEATRRLLEMGEEAVPVVEPLREHADPEIRARAAAILDEIERSRPLREVLRTAPPLALAADEPIPLAELCRRLADHFGVPVRAGAGDLAWSGRLEGATLLESADAVARDLGVAWSLAPDGLAFTAGDPPPFPAAYAGPFKVWISSLTAERSTQFAGTQVVLRFTLDGLHERQATVLGSREILVDEAAFDVGEPLAPSARGGRRVVGGQGVQILGDVEIRLADGTRLPSQASFTLAGVSPEARAIRHLRGRIALAAPVGRLEWEFAALTNGARSSAGPSGATLMMYRQRDRGGQRTLQGMITIETSGAAAGLTELRERLGLQEHAQFEFEDTAGTVARLVAAGPAAHVHTGVVTSRGQGPVQVSISGAFEEATFAPVRMRVRLPERVVTHELPFEIRDVPLP